MRILKGLAVAVTVVVVAALAAGRLGLLQGQAPSDLGVRNGQLKAPSTTPNSVSSQAAMLANHPRRVEAQIAPLHYQGDGAAAFARLAGLVAGTDGARVVKSEPGYLYATYTTPILRFVDDVEFWLDPAGSVVQVRSASRIGHGDWGVNRARIEALRARFEGQPS